MGREEILRRLNLVFESHNLPSWELRHLTVGELEIRDFAQVVSLGKNLISITFQVATPDGALHSIPQCFGGKLIYVVPLLTFLENDEGHQGSKICLQKHWDLQLHQEYYELPQALKTVHENYKLSLDGWQLLKSPKDANIGIESQKSLIHQILEDALGEHIFDMLMNVHLAPLVHFIEHSEATYTEAHLLTGTITRPLHHKPGNGEPVFFSWSEIFKMLDSNQFLLDPRTVAILLKTARKLNVFVPL